MPSAQASSSQQGTATATQTRPQRDPALDGLRGVAVLLVYVFHYGGGLRATNPAVRAFGYLTQAGWVGVELFFVLSGFLISRLLWEHRSNSHNLRDFYARRALRVLPLYYAALVAAAFAAICTGAHLRELRPLLLYAAFAQNLPNLVQSALQYPPPLPLHHLWSLAVEEQFYLLWPFLLLRMQSRHSALRLCLLLFAISCLFRSFIWGPVLVAGLPPQSWAGLLFNRGGALALGGALAFVPFGSARRTYRIRLVALLCLLAGTLLFVATGVKSGTLLLVNTGNSVLGLPGVEVACTALLALALLPGRLRSALSLRPLGQLGRISYGFYVLHILLEPVFDRTGVALTHSATGSAYQLARLLVAFPVTSAAAWISFRFLETPFLQRKRSFPAAAEPPL